jgi:hypothetical protein
MEGGSMASDGADLAKSADIRGILAEEIAEELRALTPQGFAVRSLSTVRPLSTGPHPTVEVDYCGTEDESTSRHWLIPVMSVIMSLDRVELVVFSSTGHRGDNAVFAYEDPAFIDDLMSMASSWMIRWQGERSTPESAESIAELLFARLVEDPLNLL